MSLNLENALTDTVAVFPYFKTSYERTQNTPMNEPRWIVVFKTENEDKQVMVEAIIRDEAIILSVLNTFNVKFNSLTRLMNLFEEKLKIM
jgi:hypothetical protein